MSNFACSTIWLPGGWWNVPTHQSTEEDPIYAVYQAKRHLSQRIRVFLDFLDAHFAEDPPVWRKRRSA